MQFDEVMLGRRSIRGYLPKPVPRKLIEEVLTLAMRAPTSMNTQPWHFYVITGEPLDRIRAGNTERMVAGVPQSREFRTGPAFAGIHRERQIGVAKQLFSAMGIARDDKEARQDWVLRGFRQFDAPVCVIVTYDKVLHGSDDTPFDCGAVATAPQSNGASSMPSNALSKVTITQTGASNWRKPRSTQSCRPSLSSRAMPMAPNSCLATPI